MISLKSTLNAHNKLIDLFGGAKGIRDQNLLESALGRPFATFDNMELYPTAIDKASAILESITINHPFIDGNKRSAYVLMEVLLKQGNLRVHASQNERYELVIKVSTGEFRFDEIKLWLTENTKSNDPMKSY